MTPILILAAGQSSRMRGTDKLLEIVDGLPLIQRQARRALATQSPVFITVPALDHPRADAVNSVGAKLIPVPDANLGMAQSLKAGVAALPRCPRFMVVLADLVGLDTPDFERMLEIETGPSSLIIRGTDINRNAGHPIVFDASLRPEFAELSGDTGAASIVRAHKPKTKLVSLPKDHATLDLDTPEDWAAYRAGLGSHPLK